MLLAALFGAAAFVGAHTDLARTFVDAPPFYGYWRTALGRSVLLPIAVALVVLWAARHRYEVAWPWVLLAATLAALAWSAALGLADSSVRLTYQLHGPADYARGLGPIGDHPGHYLATFTDRIRGPGGEVIARGYPVHVQGHPPGAVLALWGTTQLGLTAIQGSIVLVWSGLAATVVGVLASVRRLAGETVARAAAPFVVLLPAAVWSHTYDSFFAGIGALAVMATVCSLVPALAAVSDVDERGRGVDRRTIGWAVLGGVLFGALALLSYGLVLLALVPIFVAWRVKRLGPLLVTAAAAAVTLAVPAAWGFNWFAGLAATHHQYVNSVAARRPYGYFVWGNLVVAACAIGPAVIAGFLRAARRTPARGSAWLGAGPLILGATAAVVVADVTGLAKAEVERIYQPFLAWIALAGVAIAAVPGEVRRDRVEPAALSLQVLVAVVLATQLKSPW